MKPASMRLLLVALSFSYSTTKVFSQCLTVPVSLQEKVSASDAVITGVVTEKESFIRSKYIDKAFVHQGSNDDFADAVNSCNDLLSALKNPDGKESFRKFLEMEFSAENLAFWYVVCKGGAIVM